MVKQLVKPGEQIKDQLTAEECHMLHMAIGVAGEAGELLEHIQLDQLVADDVYADGGIVEESGDYYFYWVDLANVLLGWDEPLEDLNLKDSQIPVLGFEGLRDLAVELSVKSCAVLDLVKKICIYRKTLNDPVDKKVPDVLIKDKLAEYLVVCRLAIFSIHTSRGVDVKDVLKHNQNKLALRYGAQYQYTDTKAQDRADKEVG